MLNNRPPVSVLRFCAACVLVLGVGLAVLQVLDSLQKPSAESLPFRNFVSYAEPVAAYLGLGLGLAGLLWGIAALAAARDSAAPAAPADASRELLDAIEQLRRAVEKLADRPAGQLPAYIQAAPPHREGAAAGLDAESSTQVVSLLQDIREFSLLTEEQRQQHAQQAAQQQKEEAIRKTREQMANYELGKAGQAIEQLKTAFPEDREVAALHESLVEHQSSPDDEAFEKVRSQVEDLMAISNWDQAMALAKGFSESFPASQDGQRLVARVTRERDLYRDNTVRQMYEEVKDGIERRQWRKALSAAQRLIEKFPDHKKAGQVRRQVKTLQTNAEIEERQAAEARIQELIRSKRYSDALEIAEDLMHRFPDSPQAEQLEDLMPKLRTLAIEEETSKF